MVSPEFLAVFRAHADAQGTMTFARFMELALYHPEVGYYRRSRPRVGTSPGTDFYTASTSGPVFGELVVAAAETLLAGAGRDSHAHTLVEIGAEPDASVFAGVDHRFAGVKTLRLGEPLALAGELVVFSNELFDAQPFERRRFHAGAWHTLGVRLDGARLVEIELAGCSVPLPPPPTAPYHFDEPKAARRLAESIAVQPWRGLFLAFDYGKTLRSLREETPGGTARAYYRHTVSGDLLARPGEQDLTCHICWDWLAEALRDHGFSEPALSFQEAFFIRQAGAYIEKASVEDAAGLSRRKLALMQLLHPARLGQKFQVMHALR